MKINIAFHAAYFIHKKISFRWCHIKIRVHRAHGKSVPDTYVDIFHFDCVYFSAKGGLICLEFKPKITISMNKYACKIQQHQTEKKFSIVRPHNHCKEHKIFAFSLEPLQDKDCQFFQQAKLFFPAEGREMHSARQLVITSQRNFDMFKSL